MWISHQPGINFNLDQSINHRPMLAPHWCLQLIVWHPHQSADRRQHLSGSRSSPASVAGRKLPASDSDIFLCRFVLGLATTCIRPWRHHRLLQLPAIACIMAVWITFFCVSNRSGCFSLRQSSWSPGVNVLFLSLQVWFLVPSVVLGRNFFASFLSSFLYMWSLGINSTDSAVHLVSYVQQVVYILFFVWCW